MFEVDANQQYDDGTYDEQIHGQVACLVLLNGILLSISRKWSRDKSMNRVTMKSIMTSHSRPSIKNIR